MSQLINDNKNLILMSEVLEILQVTSRRSFIRYKKQFPVTEHEQGIGKPKLYIKSEIQELAKKINPKKNIKQKAEKLKKEKVERKVKNQKLKAEIKKELNLVGEHKPVDNLFDDEDIIKPLFNPNEFEMKDLLNEIGQDEFDRVVELLKENGTYKEQDRALVLTYAVSFQNWVFATVASAKQDNTTSDQFGNLRLHPYFQVAKEAFNQMEKSSKLLGIGVRSRLGIELKQPKKESIFDILNSKESFE